MENNLSLIKQILAEKGSIWVDYGGNSMFPTLKDGHRLLLEKVKGAAVKGGDIIAFEAPGKNGIVVHRLIEKIKNDEAITLITKADNNLCLDSELPSSRFLAKVTKVQSTPGVEAQILKTNSLSSNIYLFSGRILLFARSNKNAIPKWLHPFLQKIFIFLYRITRQLVSR